MKKFSILSILSWRAIFVIIKNVSQILIRIFVKRHVFPNSNRLQCSNFTVIVSGKSLFTGRPKYFITLFREAGGGSSFPWESHFFQVINECGSYFYQVYYDWESYYFGGLFERSLMNLSSINQPRLGMFMIHMS